MEVLSNGFTSSKRFDGYDKFSQHIDGYAKSKIPRQSIMRLMNNYCAKDMNARIIGNLSSMAYGEHAENQ